MYSDAVLPPPSPNQGANPPHFPLDFAAGYQYTTPDGTTYPAQFPAPTLQVQPGDTIDLTVHNRLAQAPGPTLPPGAVLTNIHTHGLVVSPLDEGDNVYRTMFVRRLVPHARRHPGEPPARRRLVPLAPPRLYRRPGVWRPRGNASDRRPARPVATVQRQVRGAVPRADVRLDQHRRERQPLPGRRDADRRAREPRPVRHDVAEVRQRPVQPDDHDPPRRDPDLDVRRHRAQRELQPRDHRRQRPEPVEGDDLLLRREHEQRHAAKDDPRAAGAVQLQRADGHRSRRAGLDGRHGADHPRHVLPDRQRAPASQAAGPVLGTRDDPCGGQSRDAAAAEPDADRAGPRPVHRHT